MAFTVTNTFVQGTKAKASEVNTNFTDIETEIDSIEAIQTAEAIRYQDLDADALGNISSGTYKTISITTDIWNQRSIRVKLAMDYVTSGGGTRTSQMVFGGTSIVLASGGSSTIADKYYEVEFFKTQASDGSQTIAYRMWTTSATAYVSGEIASLDTSSSNDLTVTYTSDTTGGSATSSVLWIEVVSVK